MTTLSQLSATQRQDLTRRQRLLPSSSQEPQQVLVPSETTPPIPSEPRTPDRVDARLLAALHRALSPEQRQQSCRYYQVSDLADLTLAQAHHLSAYIEARKKTPASHA